MLREAEAVGAWARCSSSLAAPVERELPGRRRTEVGSQGQGGPVGGRQSKSGPVGGHRASTIRSRAGTLQIFCSYISL